MMILSIIFTICAWSMDFGIDQINGPQIESKLAHQQIAILAHSASVDRHRRHLIDLLYPKFQLTKIFVPEHGLRSSSDSWIENGVDEVTGLPIISLYKKNSRAPSLQDLEDIDLVIIDLQDIGTRFYTYFSTVAEFLKVVEKTKIKIILLDRPNPLGGNSVSGLILDKSLMNHFISYHNIPTQHGLTLGELTKLFIQETKLQINFEIIPIKDWDREQTFQDWDRTWIAPSPAITSLEQTFFYAALGSLEQFNISIGRSLDNKNAFKLLAAPWINQNQSEEMAKELNELNFTGVHFVSTCFKAERSIYQGEDICGVYLETTAQFYLNQIDEVTYKVSLYLTQKFKNHITFSSYAPHYYGSIAYINALKNNIPWFQWKINFDKDQQIFIERRKEFLIY
jgi:uncharacterized protein YbbC (DUF1343 family)